MSTPDQIAVAQLWGHAMRCASQGFPLEESVAGLREITTRPDLLAETAGTIAGSADPATGERPWRITAARLLVRAGADRALLPEWLEVGRWNATRPLRTGESPVWPDDLDQVLADVLEGIGD